MKITIKRLSLALASVGLMTIYGCGGGGGDTASAASSSTPVASLSTFTPSLGQFSAGTAFTVKKLDGTSVSSGVIGSTGSVTLSLNGYTGPVVVTVLGAAGVTYWDEGANALVAFPAPLTLRAVVPTPMAEVGVTALTNAAVAKLEAAPGGIASASASSISDANTKVAAMFGLADILTAPTPVNSTTAASLDIASPADKYALVLAALAESATGVDNALTLAGKLAADLTDDKLDGLVAAGVTAITGTPVSSVAVAAAYQTMAATLATPTSALVVASQPLVVTPDVTTVEAAPNQADVALAKALFAELRTTLSSFSNSSKTGFLNTKLDSMATEVAANVAPEMAKVQSRVSALSYAVQSFEDAKKPNQTVFVTGTNSVGATALVRVNGTLGQVWSGTGNFNKCWTDGATALNTELTCVFAGSDNAVKTSSTIGYIKLMAFNIKQSAGGTGYDYTVARKDLPVTVSVGSVTPGAAQDPTPVPASGSGTTSGSSSTTAFSINGTFPPSTATTGVDTVVVTVAKSSLGGANYRYALSGTVSTADATLGSSKVVALSMDTGTYIDLNETNVSSTGSTGLAAKLVGTAQTAASKLTGSIAMGSFVNDKNGLNPVASNVVFNGSISDISVGGAGEILTGKVEATVSNYSTYDSVAGPASNNFMTGTMTFTGTVQAPFRPLMKLVMAVNKTGFTTDTMTLSYTYGTGISITGSGTVDSANPNSGTMTLSNQANVQMVVASGGTTVTKGGVALANIANGVVNYVDGVTESLQ